MSDYSNNIANRYATNQTSALQANKQQKKDNTSLSMEDFLLLMVKEMQSQTIDNTADTSDMLNQLVQMQMVEALTTMTEASVMMYAASMVGKEVTIGEWDADGNLQEIVGTVTATGTFNGEQVIYVNDKMYYLNQIMAVGALPEIEKPSTEAVMDHLKEEECLDIVEKMQAGDEISYTDFRVLLRELKEVGAITADEYDAALSCRDKIPVGYTGEDGSTVTYEGADRFDAVKTWTSGSSDPIEYLESWIDMVTGWYGELSEAKNEDGTPKYSDLSPIDQYLDNISEVSGQLKELKASKIETDTDNKTEAGTPSDTDTTPETNATPEAGTDSGADSEPAPESGSNS